MKGHVKPELLDDYRQVRDAKRKVEATLEEWFNRPTHKPGAPMPDRRTVAALDVAGRALQHAMDHMREDIIRRPEPRGWTLFRDCYALESSLSS